MDSEKSALLDFLGRISHELRTPLNSLLILSRRLAENDENNLTPRQLEYARAIQQSGDDLLELIDEILDLARMEAKAMPIDRRWIEISELMLSLERTFRQAAEEKHLALEIRIDPAVPAAIETDPKRLTQVLRNLLSNAIKFTDAGKVTLSIDLAQDDRICFSVKDTGIGIPKNQQEHIFDPYRPRYRRAEHEGVGLGLSISRKLTELLEGTLEVESGLGKGSTFRVMIPERLGAIKQPPILRKRTRSEVKRRTLLVIHDHPLSEQYQRAAKGVGVELVHAPTGDIGLRLARGIAPRAIIMNSALPDLDAWILLDVLKRDPKTRPIPVLVLAAMKDARRARRLGAFDCAPPPRSEQEIEEVVSSSLHFYDGTQRTVLVVGGRSFEWNGIEVEHAMTGREALAAIAAHQPSCIVIPPVLSDMSAFELMDRVQRANQQRPIPSIVHNAGEPSPVSKQLAEMVDVVIERSELAAALLTDAIAMFLHLSEESLPEERRAQVERLRTSDPSLRGRKMMIVDDDVYSIFALTSVLERHSMQVSFCESGREAVFALRSAPVDALLMDIVMPDMDGIEAIQTIRADPEHARLPIIALTARAMPGDREACLSAGADDYLPKPVDIDRLIAHLRNRLSVTDHG